MPKKGEVMLLFGHRFIESEKLYYISSRDDIAKTPPSSTLYLEFSEKNLDTIRYLNKNSIKFALKVDSITEVIYGAALGATYLHVEKTVAKKAQDIAENYLFDAKILVQIESEDEIEEMAYLGIDGILFAEAIITQ